MSSEPEPASDAPAAAKPAKPSKLVVPLLLLNLGGTGFAVFKLLTAKPAHAQVESAHPKEVKAGPLISFEPFVVNLNEPGTARYLKVVLKIEVANAEVQHAIDKRLHELRDTILSHLSGLSVAESLGVAAKAKIRNELTEAINELVGPESVRRIYFDEFVVQ